MARTRTILAVSLILCIILAVPLWLHLQPKPRPSFEILKLDCTETPSPYGHYSNYQVVFNIKNEGAGDATYVEGVIEFENNQNRTWRLIPDDYVLEPEAEYQSIIIMLDEKPTDPQVKITVECAEGVKQHFTRMLPP